MITSYKMPFKELESQKTQLLGNLNQYRKEANLFQVFKMAQNC